MTLAEIAVKLTANTAEFISGFGAAGTTAKRFRADVSEHIGAVGQVLERGLAQFGEFGASVGGVLGQATSAASQAIVSFGKLGGSMGTIVGVGAGVAAGLAVAEAGIIGIAIHSAEGAAKLGEMSEKAGVSSQTLAGLALAGRGVGVETESLVKALGFMGANAVKAAIASDYAHTAFGRLGISVKDATGHLKEGGQLFTEIVGKISSLPTQEQGFFVKAIFGRGGLEILPLINKGVDGIQEKMELAAKFGLGDPATIAASRQFKEQVDEIKAGFEGMALLLAKDLLPMLLAVSQAVSSAFQTGRGQEFINFLANIVKATAVVGEAFYAVGRAQVVFFKTIWDLFTTSLSGLADISIKLAHFDFAGAEKAAATGGAQIRKTLSGSFNDEKSTISGIFSFGRSTFGAALPVPAAQPAKPQIDVDLSPAKEDTTLARVKERILALQQEQADWANTALAASEAESLIAKAVQKGNETFGKLKTEAARDKTGAAEKFVATQEAQIKAAAASIFYDQTVVKTNEELDKQADTLAETDKAALGLATAYSKGGEAVANAALDKQFAKEAAAVAELSGVRNVAALTAKLERNEALARKVAGDELTTSLAKEAEEVGALRPAMDALNAAYLKNEDAVRAAKLNLDLQRFSEGELAKGIVVTSQQIQQKRAILETADAQAYQAALAQESAQFNLVTQYDNQIGRLQRIAALMRANGVSTLGVEAQIFDEQNRLLHQWDEWAFKVGTFQQKFRAVMGEIVIQGRNAGSAIAGAFLQAIDGVESELAKLLTGQKANFKAVFQSLAESVTKAEIQKGAGKLAEHFGIKIPGLTPKADGSETNPFYVVMKGGAAGAAFPTSNIPLFGAPGTTPGSESSGGIGGFFSSFFSSFGGAMAGGGNMSAGNWYIAGEKGPEIVSGPGTVTPAHSFGGGQTVNNHFHYPNAGSKDMFRRTEKQHAARHMRNLRLSLA